MLLSSPPWQYFVEKKPPNKQTTPPELQIWNLNSVAESFKKHLKCLLFIQLRI